MMRVGPQLLSFVNLKSSSHRTRHLSVCPPHNSHRSKLCFTRQISCTYARKARDSMDYLWTPWRYQYMKEVESGKQPECIFCDAAARKDDAETLVAYRGAKVFVILNRFPYTSGHVMIVPYAHVGDLA